MGNTGIELVFSPAEPELLPLIRQYFDSIQLALAAVYGAVLEPIAAQSRARMALQDLQGGILLMQIYQDASWLDAALLRLQACDSHFST